MKPLQYFAIAFLVGLSWAAPGQALIYTYENTTGGTLSFAATPCANPLVRNFTVNDNFTVSSIALGLNLSHNNRGHIRGVLVSPSGSTFQFLSESGDGDNNYDVLFSTNTEGAVDDNDVDPVGQPYYNRLVSVGGMNFYSGNSVGTWSLRLCDVTAATNGTYNRSKLILSSAAAAAPACSGTVSYEWGDNGGSSTPFVSTTLGDITLSQGPTSDFAGTASPPSAFATQTSLQGGQTGYYSLTMDATAVAGTQEGEDVGLVNTFNFSRPVSDLFFTLLDVDTVNNAWEDLVSVQGLDGSGNNVPFSLNFIGTADVAGDSGEGDTSAATSSTDGNIEVAFQGAVQTLILNYNQSDNPDTENVFMVVGLSDFDFCAYDYGDAPNSYGTLLAGGARHVLGGRTLYLGTNPPDGETNGQPGAASTTDDTTTVGGVDDEDGVAAFPAYVGLATTYTVPVVANNRSTTQAGSLVGYLDWNRDGDFNDAGERSSTVNVPANTTNGTFNVTWTGIPANAGGTTSTYARFRISFTAAEVTTPTGVATSGEVEDYQIPVNTLPVTLASFQSEETASGWTVRWTTETETATVGYRLVGLTPDGEISMTELPIPSHFTDSLAPETYSLELLGSQVEASQVSALALVNFDTRGKANRHGPFLLGESYGEESERHRIDWSAIALQTSLEAGLQTGLQSRFGASSKTLDRGDRTDKGDDKGQEVPVAELRVEQEGLYRVTFEDLLAAGLDFTGAPLHRIGLTQAHSGAPVPLYVEAGPGGGFGPGAFLEFRGTPLVDSLYSRQRVYRLEVLPRAALRPTTLNATPAGRLQPQYLETVSVNRDWVYSFASPNGDPWYEDRVLAFGAPGSREFPIEVEGMIQSEGVLEVELWGVTDWPGDTPDHHLQIELNDQQLVDEHFDGLTARSYQIPLPSGLLLEGENRLKVHLPGIPAYSFDLVHVDRYSITYPRHFTARDQRLTLRNTSGRVELYGFSEPSVVAWAGGGHQRLSGLRVAPVKNGFSVEMKLPAAKGGAAVADVSAVAALLKPAIAPARPMNLELLQGPADYLIIAHPAFISGLAPLISERQSQGLSVKVVDVFDLYTQYSGGEVDPEAIASYIKLAAIRFDTRFVLLVGGDTYDPFDNLGLGSISFLPTPYAQTDDLIRFSPADSLLGDLDGDSVPDLPVGRFPVRTAAELNLMVEKTLAFPDTAASALFAADEDPDQAFSILSDHLVAQVPQSWPVTTAYLDERGLESARATLLSAFNGGPAFVSFVGHSGPTVWSFQSLFASSDADSLTNVESPSLVVQWGCWNSYHVAPAYDTLAHRLLLAGPQGAAAVLGSATLAKSSSDFLIGPALTSRLFVPGTTVGEAMIEAKQDIARQGGDLRDVLIGWTLLGDPALVLAP